MYGSSMYSSTPDVNPSNADDTMTSSQQTPSDDEEEEDDDIEAK